MTIRFVLAGKSLKHKAGDPADVPELPFGKLRGVDAPAQILHKTFRRKKFTDQRLVPFDMLIAQQLESVIIHRHGECDATGPGHPCRDQGGKSGVDIASFEWIEKGVEAFA